MHKLESVQKNKRHKIIWNFKIETEHLIPARKPDLVIISKKKRIYIYIYIYIYACTLYQRLLKWYMIPPCLTLSNIRYILRVKWSNPGEELCPPLHLGVITIEKGAFWSLSTTVAKFTRHICMYIYMFIYIVIHRQICFVLSELISVARHTRFP